MVKRKCAVEIKCRRLDIEVEVAKKNFVTTTTSIIPLSEAPHNIKEILKMLAGVLKSGCGLGLSKVEVQRLEAVSMLA